MKKMKRWFALVACLVVAVGTFGIANTANAVDTAGVYTDKQVTPVTDAQGNVTGYKVRLESWVTGTVQSVTSTAPLDIVLVLDQSSSMAYNFSGETTSSVTETRQYAMQQAVNSFIGEVAGKYQAENSDHRIALVTFGDSAATLAGWTAVDTTGAAMLQASINGLPSDPTGLTGLTNVSAGMTLAKQLTVDNYSYSGTNKADRQKIVILFTDGVPTNSSDDKNFDTALANNALSAAANMKKNGVTVYSIGIFNGAEPSQMYGDAWTYSLLPDLPCNGKVGEYWGGSWLQSIIGQNDFAGIDIAAGNRFLNLLSSNFGSIVDVGVDRGWHDPYNSWLGATSGTGYKITIEYNLTTTGYYKTASNASELGNIFTEISEDIETVSSDLGAQAYIADTVSSYFTAPSNVAVYVSSYNGNSFGADQPAVEVSASISGQTVTVSGFDYTANFVTDKAHTNGTYGQKLIVEYTVGIQSDFFGGNRVPFNGSGCGVYDANGTEVQSFEDKAVDVPINYQIATTDQTVYLSQSANLGRLLTYAAGDTPNGTNNAFVDITYSLKQNGAPVATYAIRAGEAVVTSAEPTWAGTSYLTECTPYTLDCTVSPALPAAADGVNAWTDSKAATVHVLEPRITSENKTIYLSNSAPLNAAVGSWKCSCTVNPKTARPGPADPVPQYTYYRDGVEVTADAPDTCTTYTASVALGGRTFENAASFTVHVMQPVITTTSTTIYYGTTTNLTQRAGLTGWLPCGHSNVPVVMSGSIPTANFSFKEGEVNVTNFGVYSPADCTPVTPVLSVTTGSTTKVVNYSDKDFWVHVATTTLTPGEVTIYRGNTVNLNTLITEGEWKCATHNSLPTNTKPSIDFIFNNGSENPVENELSYAPIICEEVAVSAKIGNKDSEPLSGNVQIHVLQPSFTVTTQDVWADCGTAVDLTEHCIAKTDSVPYVLDWTDTTQGHTTPEALPDGEPEVDKAEFSFKQGDAAASNSYTVGEKDGTFNVDTMTFKFNNTYEGTVTFQNLSFAVHVNTFTLTITKAWKDEKGNTITSNTYKQDAIFTVTREDTGDKLQVVIPVDTKMDSIKIDGLLCGKEYTVTEDSSWTWRWAASGALTTHHTNPGHATITTEAVNNDQSMTFTNTLKSGKIYWLDGDAWCDNNFDSKKSFLSKLGLD